MLMAAEIANARSGMLPKCVGKCVARLFFGLDRWLEKNSSRFVLKGDGAAGLLLPEFPHIDEDPVEIKH